MSAIVEKEFAVALVNEPGALAEVAAALERARVSIRGLLVEAQGDFAIARLVTDDPRRTEQWLQAEGLRYRTRDVLSVAASHEPGSLARIAQMLAASGVNVEAAYASAAADGQARLTFAVDDLHSAQKILGEHHAPR